HRAEPPRRLRDRPRRHAPPGDAEDEGDLPLLAAQSGHDDHPPPRAARLPRRARRRFAARRARRGLPRLRRRPRVSRRRVAAGALPPTAGAAHVFEDRRPGGVARGLRHRLARDDRPAQPGARALQREPARPGRRPRLPGRSRACRPHAHVRAAGARLSVGRARAPRDRLRTLAGELHAGPGLRSRARPRSAAARRDPRVRRRRRELPSPPAHHGRHARDQRAAVEAAGRVMAKTVAIVHHADRRTDVHMPYAPGIVVTRGRLVFLSGVTAAAVYHSHPHRDEEFDLPPTMREQAVLAMENLKKTLAAAGCGLRDLVSATRFLTDVREQDDLNRVWAEYLDGHLPTTTTVEVSRLATHPRCKIEISAIAVTDDLHGGPDMALNSHGGPDMAPKPPTLGPPRRSRRGPR